jgi:hypothetical protein
MRKILGFSAMGDSGHYAFNQSKQRAHVSGVNQRLFHTDSYGLRGGKEWITPDNPALPEAPWRSLI